MFTVVLERPGQFATRQTPLPEAPGPGQALVRVRQVGICGTDLHAFRGRQPFFSYPRILGHELGVEVEALGDSDTDLQVGDRCAVEPYLYCGSCVACRQGKTNCCTTLACLGVHTDGGMRERIVLPVRNLHRANARSFEQLALVETLGIGAHAVRRAAPQPGEWALVVGAGPIGLATMLFARDAGANVIALDTRPDRLAFCQRALGIPHALAADDHTLDTLRSITAGDLPGVLFDATGNPESMAGTLALAAPGGRVVWVGLCLDAIPIPDPEFHRKELTLLATRNATAVEFAQILAGMDAGRIDTAPWITHRCHADALIEHFPAWLIPETGVIKAMVEF